MDLLDGLVHQAPKEILGGTGRRKLVKPEKFVLPWACFKNLEVAREAKSLPNGPSGAQTKE